MCPIELAYLMGFGQCLHGKGVGSPSLLVPHRLPAYPYQLEKLGIRPTWLEGPSVWISVFRELLLLNGLWNTKFQCCSGFLVPPVKLLYFLSFAYV